MEIKDSLNNISSSLNAVIFSPEDLKNMAYNELSETTGFNVRNWNEIVQLQTKINVKVFPDWEVRNLNWKLAILIENAELLDSTNWSWWKVRENDWNNITIEMIDIFHFLLAMLIEQKATNTIIPYIAGKEVQTKDLVMSELNNELANSIIKKMSEDFILSLATGNLLSSLIIWFDVWYSMGKNSKDLFKLYKMKYTLNIFRQDHGYKEGTYQKIWNSQEDNVTAFELIKDLENDNNFIDQLYNKFELIYGTVEDIIIKNTETFISSNEKWNLFFVNIPKATQDIIRDFANEYSNYLEK